MHDSGTRTDEAAAARTKPGCWSIGAYILAAVIGLLVVVVIGAVAIDSWGYTDSMSQDNSGAESPASVKRDIRSAYGSELSTLSVTLTPASDGGAGTMHVRYRLKGTGVDVDGEFDAFSGLADSGLAPPLAGEQDRLSADETRRLIRVWSKRSHLSIGGMNAFASVEQGEEDFATFSGHKYAVADLWYVESSDGDLSWAVYRDPKRGAFVPVQKNPDLGTSPN